MTKEKPELKTYYFKIKAAVPAKDRKIATKWVKDKCFEVFGNGYFTVEYVPLAALPRRGAFD